MSCRSRSVSEPESKACKSLLPISQYLHHSCEVKPISCLLYRAWRDGSWYHLTWRRYNKQESDFTSREEWDDYLEEREDISKTHPKPSASVHVARTPSNVVSWPVILSAKLWATSAVYSLVEKEDVDKAEAKIAAYERKNLENIVQNEARKVCSSVLSRISGLHVPKRRPHDTYCC